MSAPAPALSTFDILGPVRIGASGFPATVTGPLGVPTMELGNATLGGLGIAPTAQQLTERWITRCGATVPPQV